MARPLRTAFHIVQTATAGPSRPLLRPPVIPHTHLQRRSVSFGSLMPRWMNERRRAQKEEEERKSNSKQAPGNQVEAVKTGGTATGDGSEEGGIFEGLEEEQIKVEKQASIKTFTEHRYSTAKHKISPRKLNLLARQIAGLPIDEAILQMQFSEKAASKWIKSTLALAKDHALMYKKLDKDRLIVAESIVNKEKYGPKQIDPKGRGRHGIKRHPYSRLKLVLKESKPRQELLNVKFEKELNKLARSAGNTREDGKLRRKVLNGWAW